MQPTSTPEAIISSNVQGDVAKMRIHEDAHVHVMDTLSKALYSEPVYAVIREYSTNARDAHVEAGNEAPIEITLPNPLKPVFKVKDYGTGLTVDDVHAIYSQYGMSTKRDSNEYNGYLGFGCKSAFAYTDQFTVTSIKNGVKITVMVARDEEGAGEMTTVDTRATTEPNGTEVSIPVTNHWEFARWAKHLYRFWPEGSVLVDGEAPARVTGLSITDDILVTDGGQDYIVMGNVPYPVDLGYDLSNSKAIVAFVENGTATFMTSREALKMTDPTTKATIAKVKQDFDNAVKSAVQDAIANAKNGAEALATVVKWQRDMPKIASGEYRFKGRVVPTSFEIPKGQRVLNVPHSTYRLADHDVQTVAYSRVSWPKTVWVTNYDQETFTATTKKKLVKFCEDNGLDWNHALVMEGRPSKVTFWLEKARVIDWATIKAVKLPRSGNVNGGRKSGSYDCFVAGQAVDQMMADELDTDEPMFYLTGDRRDARKYVGILTSEHPDCTVVYFYANREAKFCREFPDAKHAHTGAQEAYDKWVKKLSRKDRLALLVQDNFGGHLANLDPKQIEDPALVFAVKLYKRDIKKVKEERSRFRDILGRIDTRGKLKFDNPLSKYPLFTNCYNTRSFQDHVYIYLNAVYAAATK